MKLSAEEQKLVERALPTVEHLARRAKGRFPRVPYEDLLSFGNQAVVEAIKTFDRSHGTPFEVFAFKRIYGAMIREATVEASGRLHIAIRRAFHHDDDMAAPPAELGLDEALEDSPEKAKERAASWARKQAGGMMLAALAAMLESTPDVERTVIGRAQRAHAEKMLAIAMADLDEDERYFVKRFYHESATLETIAGELGVVKRTVTRLHDRIKTKLAKSLRKRGVEEAPPSER
jgi:RNA polymerase sigma factor FliA